MPREAGIQYVTRYRLNTNVLDYCRAARVMTDATVSRIVHPARNAIVCSIATLFRTSHGCAVPTTTWSAMPSSLVFATDTRPSCGFGRICRCQRIDRPVSGDDADGIIDRREQRLDGAVPLRAELLPGRSEEGAVGGDFFRRSAISLPPFGVPSITTRPRLFWPVAARVDARQQPAHGMADEMDGAVDALAKRSMAG